MLVSQHLAPGIVLALAIQPGCTAELLDAQDVDTDGEVTGAGETLDVSFPSGTDEAGASSESGEESGGGSGGEAPWPPPEEPDDSCLENLPAPESQDKVWIAAGGGGPILRSTDAVHWDPIEIGSVGMLSESASVGSTFVLAASSRGANIEVDELFVSDDGGLTWDLLASGLPTGLHDVEGVGDLFLARDEAGATSYWSADGRTWQEAQGVAATGAYAVGPAGILSGLRPGLDVTLSVNGKVWSELLPTMGLSDDYLRLAGRGDQYLAWPYEFPPNRFHSSVDGLTWTTSDIAVGMPPDDWWAYTGDVRWNGAQYVLYGSWVGPLAGLTDANYMIARSCNGRVWHYNTLCSSWDPPSQNTCQLFFASTAAMTVVVLSNSGFSDADLEGYVESDIRYSADLVTWKTAGWWDYSLTTVVVGDP